MPNEKTTGLDPKFEHLLALYKELFDWCQKHDIKLILACGSALGAIRHRGVIPWDFDVDTCVSWTDYKKLVKAWKKDPIPNREMVNGWRFEDYPSLFTRYVDTTTTEIRAASAWDIAPCGMSLDVFPMVPVPRKNSQRAIDAFCVYYEMKVKLLLGKRTRTESMRAMLRKSLRDSRYFGEKHVLRKLHRLAFSGDYEDCDYCFVLSGGAREPRMIPRSVMGDPIPVEIEGLPAYVPEKYCEYLQIFYGGSWRYYPPKVGEGYHYVDNLVIPYDVYINDYMQLLDKEKVLSDLKHYISLELQDVLDRPQANCVVHRVRIEPYTQRVLALGRPSDYPDGYPEEARKVLDAYLNKQLNHDYNYWCIWGGIDDEWFAAMCDYLCDTNQYARALKLVGLRQKSCSEPLSAVAQLAKARVDNVFAALDAVDYGDTAMAEQRLEALDARDRETLPGVLVELFLKSQQSSSEDEWNSVLDYAKQAQEAFPKDYELKRYEALALGKLGNAEASKELYDRIQNKCRNGMTVLRAGDDRKELGLE